MTAPDRERPAYLPFEGGRFRLAMGLMPLALHEWIETDAAFAADLAAKRALFERRHDEAFAALPEADAPAAELLALLTRHLPRHHGGLFRRSGDILINLATGERWDWARPTLHPLELAGRLVQEDFCLLAATDGRYRLVGAALCAPSRWRLADKIGRPLEDIHAPVPGYEARLAHPVERFFAVLKIDKPVWRLNWTIIDHPASFQPVRIAPTEPVTAATAGDALWLRVERQTLRRLPESGAVVFAIRTYITRLGAAIATAAIATELAALLRDAPAATLAYKHITPFAAALLAWLDARAHAGG